jgi:hypothetical protein
MHVSIGTNAHHYRQQSMPQKVKDHAHSQCLYTASACTLNTAQAIHAGRQAGNLWPATPHSSTGCSPATAPRHPLAKHKLRQCSHGQCTPAPLSTPTLMPPHTYAPAQLLPKRSHSTKPSSALPRMCSAYIVTRKSASLSTVRHMGTPLLPTCTSKLARITSTAGG